MKEKKGEHPFGDAGQLILLGVFLLIWSSDSFFFHFSTFLSEQIPIQIRLIFLLSMLMISLYLFKSGHVAVELEHPAKGVISSGAFRYVRHPLYLASMLSYLGLSVSTMSLLSLFLLPGIFTFYNFIAGYEEKLMVQKYGEDYQQYQNKVGKWFPQSFR